MRQPCETNGRRRRAFNMARVAMARLEWRRGRTAGVPARSGRTGHTLVEMLVAASILSVVVVGVGSAVLVASHAVPGGVGTSASSAAAESCDAASVLASELSYARAFTELTPTAVTFTVPDRDSDGAEDTIRYSWDGTPGSPLRRTYNGAAADLAGGVRAFALSYDRETVSTEQTVNVTQTSAEMLLASFNGWPGASASVMEHFCSSQTWAAQYFKPSGLPASANKLTVTRAKLLVRRGVLPTGTFSVCVQKAIGSGNPKPSNIRIGSVTTVAAASLGTGFFWVDVPLSGVTLTSPTQELCLVVRGDLTSQTFSVVCQYHLWTSAPTTDGVYFSYTSTAGSSWSPVNSQIHYFDMPFYVYGTYESDETQTTTTSTHYLRGVGINLSAGPDGAPKAHTSVRVLNRPEVTGS